MVVGLVLSLLPHLASWSRSGDWGFLAYGDDSFYLAIAKTAYVDGQWALRDPFAGAAEQLPTLFSAFPFAPAGLLARIVGLPPDGIAIILRVLGAVVMVAGSLALCWEIARQTSLPFGGLLLLLSTCLADPAMITGRPLVDWAALVADASNGTVESPIASKIGQWRIITPSANLGFLFIFAAALMAIERKHAAWIAGLALAACFWSYFFFWTAACIAAAAMFIFFLLKPPGKLTTRDVLLRFGVIAAISLPLASPVLYHLLTTAGSPEFADQLQRMSRGQKLSSDDPRRFDNLVNFTAVATIIVGFAAAYFFRNRAMLVLTSFCVSGFALRNSAIVSGLEFENWHWNYVHAPFGALLLVLLPLRLARSRLRTTAGTTAAAFFSAVLVCGGAAYLWVESQTAPQARDETAALREFRPFWRHLSESSPDELLAVRGDLAGPAALVTAGGILYHEPYSLQGSLLQTRDAIEREVLNGLLHGETQAAITARSTALERSATIDAPWGTRQLSEYRRQALVKLSGDSAYRELQRLKVRHAILPLGQKPALGTWNETARTDRWALWTRSDGR